MLVRGDGKIIVSEPMHLTSNVKVVVLEYVQPPVPARSRVTAYIYFNVGSFGAKLQFMPLQLTALNYALVLPTIV